MSKTGQIVAVILTAASVLTPPGSAADNYSNFKVAVYARAYEVRQMATKNLLLRYQLNPILIVF